MSKSGQQPALDPKFTSELQSAVVETALASASMTYLQLT
jgi:hypothetical protein